MVNSGKQFANMQLVEKCKNNSQEHPQSLQKHPCKSLTKITEVDRFLHCKSGGLLICRRVPRVDIFYISCVKHYLEFPLEVLM
jgi:hypothetical protein